MVKLFSRKTLFRLLNFPAFVVGDQSFKALAIDQREELVRLRRQVLQQSVLVNQIAAPCIIQDTSGKVEMVNPAFERTFGYTLEESIGKYPRDIAGGELTDLAKVEAAFNAVMQGGSIKRDEVFYHCDGSPVWVNYVQHGVTDELNNLSFIVTTAIDISDRVKAEQSKTDFVAMVGHELRTPLTAVAGTIDILSDSRFVKLPAELTEIVKGAQRGCAALNALVGDLLDINKIESGHVPLDTKVVDVSECIHAVISELDLRAKTRGIRLKVPEIHSSSVIHADSSRIRQVLTNLMTNAIKYGHENGSVRTEVFEQGGELVVRVIDDGPGINPKDRAGIFEKFSRAPSAVAQGIEGFGLGLSICKGLVEQMGGSLTLEPPQAQGTCFRFAFPCYENQESNSFHI